MKIISSIIFTLILLALLGACGGKNTATLNEYEKKIYTPRYASGFEIKGADGTESVIISIKQPWQGADGISKELFIDRDGEGRPNGFHGQVLTGNAHRIVVMSSTHIAMLCALAAGEKVVGVSGKRFISNPEITSRSEAIGDVGYEGNINYEVMLSLNPDIVLLYGVTGPSSIESKLEELGIPYMYVGDYLEESPIGKAEWMVALAELIGEREEGIKEFSQIPVRYNAIKDKVAQNARHLPKVMLNTPFGDSWFMPSSESYVALLVKDAGGDYIYKKDTGNSSMPIDIEEAYRLASQADVWLNVGSVNSLDELKTLCPEFTDTKCFLTGAIYNNNAAINAAGGNDYYESAIVRPDILLRDMVKIFHPELVEEDFVYYKQLK